MGHIDVLLELCEDEEEVGLSLLCLDWITYLLPLLLLRLKI